MESEMRYVYAVYQHRSFSKAADALFMTQPALSMAISKLESRLGLPLFDRTTKPLTLTEAGAIYIQKYEEIALLEQELQAQMNDLSSVTSGTLRIGGTNYFNSYVLPPVLTGFLERYPGVELQLVEAASGDLLEMAADHKIDITFHCERKPDSRFRRVPCFSDQILLAVPKKDALQHDLMEGALTAEQILRGEHKKETAPGIDLKRFSELPFLLLTPGNNLYTRSQAFFAQAGIAPRVKLQVSQLVTAWHLCCAGMGATFLSDFLVQDARNQNVVFYKLSSSEAVRVFQLTISSRRYVSHAMQAFQKEFLEYYPNTNQ